MMPEMNGIEFLQELHTTGVDIPVIVQTGQGGIETVVQAMRAGAFDFVVKPVSPERIAAAISNALKLDQREAKARAGARSVQARSDSTISSRQARYDAGHRSRPARRPVEHPGRARRRVGRRQGTRRARHPGAAAIAPVGLSSRSTAAPFPHNLVESILFGHEKGAFTGAAERHVGKFMEADGGTLFLDEIGDLPLDVQVKLLRAVQQGEIETVGARMPQKVDVRLISATNKDLIEEVKAGRFREDLYYRLNVFPITMPALRRRKEDISYLVRVFVDRFSAEQKINPPLGISADVMAF